MMGGSTHGRLILAVLSGWCSSGIAQGNPPDLVSVPCPERFPTVACVASNAAPEDKSPTRVAILPISVSPVTPGHAKMYKAAAAAMPDTQQPSDVQTDNSGDLPFSKEALFGISKPGDANAAQKSRSVALKGFVQNETAYTYADPAHWSRAVVRTQLAATGQVSENLKWKATVRVDVDPIYQWSQFYPDPVKDNQRFYFLLGETYIDTSLMGWDLRLGRQNIVWGEVTGLFFADVVSAQDQRDFLLPGFDIIRIPQWAARAEYFYGDSHVELIWIPYPTYNQIGKPGADFFPFQVPPPPGFSQSFRGEVQPDHALSNSNYGVRLSTLKGGWDMAGFYYRSEDSAATFVRDVDLGPNPSLVYQPVHDHIWQSGMTLSKDLGSVVFKSEAVYTAGRRYNVTRLSEPTGVVTQNTLDYIVSFDFTLPAETRLNAQLFQRVFFDHDPDLLFDRFENGASILLSGKLTPKWQPEILWIQSLNRWENLIRPRLNWYPEANWRVSLGVDIFNGPITGFFGRFNDRDRVYAELRYDF